MNVAIDAHMIGDHSGGNESYYTNIIKAMNPHIGDKYFLFVSKNIDTTQYKNKFEVVQFESDSAFKRNFIELNRLCKKFNIDVLHTQYFIPFFRSCNVVCTIHDICFEHYKDIFTKKEYVTQKILIPYAAKKSKCIFTVSENAKEDIISTYRLNPQKVIVTYNAVNEIYRRLSENEIDRERLNQKYGIDEEYILTVGNLQPRKNLPRLIKAYTKYKRAGGKEKLVIVGKKTRMTSEIFKEISNSEFKDNIILTDYVENEDLVQIYNAAKGFVYPSYFEGFGIPPLEAMACGTPVAVANTTSLPEVVGDVGIYFNPFDENDILKALEQLISLVEEKRVNFDAMQEQVNKFSWSKSAKILVDSYSTLNE